MKRYIYLLFILIFPAFLLAQKEEDLGFQMPDSVIVSYHHILDRDTSYAFQDNDLDHYYHQYDPRLKRRFIYHNLGNAGSAATPTFYTGRHKVGFSSGFRQYDLYRKTVENLRVYDGNAPVVTARFSPITDETNFIVQADFGRKFTDATSLSINYDRINQEGIYDNQAVSNTNFGLVYSIGERDSRYQGDFILINNAIAENQNGGVADTSQFRDPVFLSRSLVTVNNSQAASRYQERRFVYTHRYQWTEWLAFHNSLSYRREYYKYYDTSPNPDYYGSFLVDDRGVRYLGEFKTRAVSMGLDIDQPWLHLSGGLRYAGTKRNDEYTDDTYRELQLYGSGVVPIGNQLHIDLEGRLGFLDDGGEFDVEGSIAWKWGSYIELQGGSRFYRHSPAYIEEHFALNAEQQWSHDWEKPLGAVLYGKVSVPLLKIDAEISQTVENNSIYFNADKLPYQYDEVFTLTSMKLSHRIGISIFHLENDVLLQYASADLYGLPKLYLRHHAYLQKRIFRENLNLRLGAEFRHAPEYHGKGFEPFTGQFYRTGNAVSWYPDLDVYLSGQIENFRVFIKYENALSRQRTFPSMPIMNYPEYDRRLRFGISWMFFN